METKKRLSKVERRDEMVRMADALGTWAGAAYFASRTGVSEDTAREDLKALAAEGRMETRLHETLEARNWLQPGRLRRVSRQFRGVAR